MSRRPTKRTRGQDGASSSSAPPIPRVTNQIVGRGGKEGRAAKTILDGFYLNEDELQGTHFWSLVQSQNWEKFVTSSHPIYPDLVYYFYEHAQISLGPGAHNVRFTMHLEGNRILKYTTKDFLEDFGLECRGFGNFIEVDSAWPEALPSYVNVISELNNGRVETPLSRKKKDIAPWLQFFTGDDRLTHFTLSRALMPTYAQDRRLSRMVACFIFLFRSRGHINLPVLICHHMTYALQSTKVSRLPYGMLISHVMMKWAIMSPGPATIPIHVIGTASLKSQKLHLVRGRFLWGWQVDEASDEDRAQMAALLGRPLPPRTNDVEEESEEVGGEEEEDEQEDEEVNEPRRNSRRLSANENLSRVIKRQEQIMKVQAQQEKAIEKQGAAIKKQGKFLKSMMKFLGCLGRGEGSSDAAQRYLVHSDSEEEHATQEEVVGTPVDPEDYGLGGDDHVRSHGPQD